MMCETATGVSIDSNVIGNYFKTLVNQFFKILPMREQNESTLVTYMQSLQVELMGCNGFVATLKNDASYITLLSILQYLIDNPECSVKIVRREVFRAISICNKLRSQYSTK